MRLRPGAAAEYRHRHAAAWPELLEAIRSAGVRTFTIYGDDEKLLVHSVVSDAEAWRRAWATDVHARWAAHMEPLIELRPEGAPATRRLVEIFHLEPA